MTAIEPFVIVSNARSGTSLVTSTLRFHPEVYCHGEIFHPKIEVHLLPEARERIDVSRRESDPTGFAREVLGFAVDGHRVVGFKMWRPQAPEACDDLLADGGVRKIILERVNRLASYSSAGLARKTGVWNVGPTPDPEVLQRARSASVRFDGAAFRQHVDRQDQLFAYYRSHAKGPVLNILYTDLVKPDGMRPILSFLGVRDGAIEKKKSQLHSSNILERFDSSSRPEIMRTLDMIGHPDWAVE